MPRRSVNVKEKICESLASGPKTWNSLKATGLSKGALSKHLRQLILENIVQAEVDQFSRPLSRIYKLNPSPPKRVVPIVQKQTTNYQNRSLSNPERRKEVVRLAVLNAIHEVADTFYEMPKDGDVSFKEVKDRLLDSIVQSSQEWARLRGPEISKSDILDVLKDILDREVVQFGFLRHYGLKLDKKFTVEYESVKRGFS